MNAVILYYVVQEGQDAVTFSVVPVLKIVSGKLK